MRGRVIPAPFLLEERWVDLVGTLVDAVDMDMPTPMEAALGARTDMVPDVVEPIKLTGGIKIRIENKECVSVFPGL